MSYKHKSRTGFTLVELLVSLVIISILAALSLSGLSAVRRRSREEATRTTIRKIHEIIVPQYESYLDKRVSQQAVGFEHVPTIGERADCYFAGPPPRALGRRIFAFRKLAAIRRTLAVELPDNWADVGDLSPPLLPRWVVPSQFESGITTSFMNYKVGSDAANASAECLYMICLLSGFQPESMENFRSQEIGDVDADGKPEFIDAWGKPIAFIRCPVGFSGSLTGNNTAEHDPFDPDQIDVAAFRVMPLIFSAGLDQEYGLVMELPTATASVGGSIVDMSSLTLCDRNARSSFGSSTGPASQDNISNHDLITR